MEAAKPPYGELLEVASHAGKLLLENGGEIYRTEETVHHICSAYGVNACECFATPTALMLSITGGGEIHTIVRRITSRKVNLTKVDAVNTLSRQLDGSIQSMDEVRRSLNYVENMPTHLAWKGMAASTVGVAAFTVVFGGDFANALGGALAGLLTYAVTWLLQKYSAGDFMANMAGGAVSTFTGWLAVTLGISADWWLVTLSSLMLLVPGMLITNALRNIAAGDLVSGGSNTTEAFSIAAALSCGTVICSAILYSIGDITLWT